MLRNIVCLKSVPVHDTESSACTSNPLLSNRLNRSLELKFVDSGGFWFTVTDTLADGPLATSPLHAGSVDADTLLGLVSQTPGLVRSSRSVEEYWLAGINLSGLRRSV